MTTGGGGGGFLGPTFNWIETCPRTAKLKTRTIKADFIKPPLLKAI
jgi:hypothetical protein